MTKGARPNEFKTNETEMKKTRFHIISYLAAMAVVSMTAACSSGEDVEEASPTPQPQTFTVTASQSSDDSNGATTRVGFYSSGDNKGEGFWQAGDTIGVWSKGEGKFKPFAIASGEGTGTATFTGEIIGELEYNAAAIYPYSDKDYIDYDNDLMNIYFPDTYTYTSVDSLVSEKEGNSFNMPMYGLVEGTETTDRTINFGNFGGVIVLVFDKIPQEGTVTVTAENAISGNAQIVDKENVEKVLKYVSTADSCKTVTFNYSGAEKMQQGVFYLPLVAGTYTLTVKIDGKNQTSDGTGEIQYVNTITFSEFTLEQGHLKKKSIATDYDIYVNGHKFIDLGLESGLLWAETNVGAEVAADYGNFYAWGEVEPMTTETPTWYTYKWGDYNARTKYNTTDGLTQLQPEDDAATANWGTPCRMPTYQECYDIMNYTLSDKKTNVSWTSRKNSMDYNRSGELISSLDDKKSVFIPASGYYYNGYKDEGDDVRLWTATRRDTDDTAYGICVDLYTNKTSGNSFPNFYNYSTPPRYTGSPVRAVVQP